MLIYRISSSKYIEDLSGAGAKQYGGRWNNKRTAVVYLAETRAMAVMEVLVHLSPEQVDRPFVLATFDVPDDKIYDISIFDLPEDWRDPQTGDELKKIGDKFVRDGIYLLMKVPSIILEEEFNFIINPNHPDSKKIKLVNRRDFVFDKRFKT
jgi:RES domain-containing protein